MRAVHSKAIFIALGVMAVGLIAWHFLVSSQPIVQKVESAFSRGEMRAVLKIVESQRGASSDPILYWRAGLAADSLSESDVALSYFQQALSYAGEPRLIQSVLMSTADVAERKLQFKTAIEALVKIPVEFANDSIVLRRKAQLLDRMGRRFEANQYHLKRVIAGQQELEDVVMLANRKEPYVDQHLEQVLKTKAKVEDAYRLSLALVHVRSGNLPTARELLVDEVNDFPEQVAAHALLGLVLTELGALDQLSQWNRNLPSTSGRHPDVWYVRGFWAESLGDTATAVLCYRRSVELDPCFHGGIFRLLSLLDDQQIDLDLKNRLTDYQADLRQYEQLAKRIYFEGPEANLVTQAITLAEKLFRFHEAIAWCHELDSALGGFGVTGDQVQQLSITANQDQSESQHPVDCLLRQWTIEPSEGEVLLARVNALGSLADGAPEPGIRSSLNAQFANQAADLGVNFSYDNGTDQPSGFMIQESMGGGVGVIDIDRDGWPDLFFPQGSRLQDPGSDALFRNRGGKQFDRVEQVSGVVDFAYSHGVAVGDCNEDGFPDLLVANRGQNQFLVNNGDGTFEQSSVEVTAENWTISVLIVDLNGDSLPDLFEVNYLMGELPFEKVCIDPAIQLPRTCPPEHFSGEVNEVYLNDGVGGFRRVTSRSGLSEVTGKSLGAVAADFEGHGEIALFVANDQVPNEFLQPMAGGTGSPPEIQFSETAVHRGLAYNGKGEALACMGIASGDINHDGLPDMFVTNFYLQENTLYTSTAGGVFRDMTNQARLREPSLQQLGFGTQFLDANLDSEPDLVVGNGHLDDFTDRGIPFAMSPQLLMNAGDMQFQVLPPETVGAWFRQVHLARGIAKLDWNCDGLEDFAVSQIDEPAGLLTNQTQAVGNVLNLVLIGVRSARDAVGARVKIRFAGRDRWMQVTAGDGYASSNQKMLTFGLGQADVVDSVTVHWPSGVVQTFDHVLAGRHYHVVEGHERLLLTAQ